MDKVLRQKRREPIFQVIHREVQKLQNTLDGLTDQFIEEEYQEFCKMVEEYTDRKILYFKCRQIYEEYISSTVLPSLLEKHDEWLLRELIHRWENHKLMVRWMSISFDCLTYRFITRHPRPTLEEVGLACFSERAFVKICANVTATVLRFIHKEREGETIDRSLLKHVINIYVEIGVGFRENLEREMVEHTRAYYARKASNWFFENSCPDYMLKAEECLSKRDIVSHYLRSTNEQSVVEVRQHELLVVYATRLLQNEHSGCRALFRHGQVEDLSRIFRLYHEIPLGRAWFAVAFRQHVTSEGEALVQEAAEGTASVQHADDAARKQVLVRKLIELHHRYKNNMINHFPHNDICLALRGAFMLICNIKVPGMSIAVALALFCDQILKKGVQEQLKHGEKDETIDTVVKLIDCVDDKDRFTEVYRHRLADRLLIDQTDCKHSEGSIISTMKQAHGGAQFTRKMEIMLNDVRTSREEMTSYMDYCFPHPNARAEMALSINVLTRSQWPSYDVVDIKLPKKMVKWAQDFDHFYKTKWKHRKLQWIHSMGTCILECNFGADEFKLQVSTSQAALLMLFNKADRLSLSKIKTQLGITDDILARLVRSVSCGKYKILKMVHDTRTGELNLVFNSVFSPEHEVLELPFHKLIDDKKAIDKVDQERPFAIQAALVRAAKIWKVISHKELIRECVERIEGFKPNINAVKIQIEDLIHRGFLKREYLEQASEPVYHYLPE